MAKRAPLPLPALFLVANREQKVKPESISRKIRDPKGKDRQTNKTNKLDRGVKEGRTDICPGGPAGYCREKQHDASAETNERKHTESQKHNNAQPNRNTQ